MPSLCPEWTPPGEEGKPFHEVAERAGIGTGDPGGLL